MTVIGIAMTPSLKASIRPVVDMARSQFPDLLPSVHDAVVVAKSP